MIITDESLLKVSCEDVLPDEINSLREKLETELNQSAKDGRPGIGLAAPQIGINKRMAIIRIPIDNNKTFSLDIVNLKPQNITKYDKYIFQGEGCLSFPNRYEKTWRYKEIHVVNNAVEPKAFILTGLPAVVVQHEQDHLDGILFTENII